MCQWVRLQGQSRGCQDSWGSGIISICRTNGSNFKHKMYRRNETMLYFNVRTPVLNSLMFGPQRCAGESTLHTGLSWQIVPMAARRVYETAEEASTELVVENVPRRRRRKMGKEDGRKLKAFRFWCLTNCDYVSKVPRKIGSWLWSNKLVLDWTGERVSFVFAFLVRNKDVKSHAKRFGSTALPPCVDFGINSTQPFSPTGPAISEKRRAPTTTHNSL